MADVVNGVVYESVFPIVTADFGRNVSPCPDYEHDYDFHEPPGRPLFGGWYFAHHDGDVKLAGWK